MKRSIERILVTHQGTLPRPDDLRDMLSARRSGQPYNPAVLAERLHRAVQIDDPDLANDCQVHPHLTPEEYRKVADDTKTGRQCRRERTRQHGSELSLYLR